MEGNIFASTETVECPLCSQSFQPSVINRHVNNCLNVTDSSSGTTDQGKKRKSSEGPGSPKSAWGSLKPQKPAAGPSAKKAKTASPKKGQSKKSVNNNSVQGDKYVNNAENTPFVEKPKSNTSNIPVFGMSKQADSVDSVSSVVPLAEKLRPLSLEDYVGQEKAVGKKSMLRSLMKSNDIPSMILWGPPGCGKVRENSFFFFNQIFLRYIISRMEMSWDVYCWWSAIRTEYCPAFSFNTNPEQQLIHLHMLSDFVPKYCF